MVQSPSGEANCFAASQVIPRISRNPKVHYRIHKLPTPVSTLDQPNPVHIPTSHLLEIYPNIIHPSTPRSPQWSPSLRFPQQEPISSIVLKLCYIKDDYNRRERDHRGDLGVDGWIILGWISRRWDVGIWTGLGWPRIERGGGRL